MDIIRLIDGDLLIKLQELLIHDQWSSGVIMFTNLGKLGLIWIIITIILLIFKKTRKYGIAAGLALLIMLIVNNGILKNLIDRQRPYEVFEGVRLLIPPENDSSFPSGHTAAAFAFANAILKTGARKIGWILMCVAFLMGLSRIYVGVHYPGDVLFGIIMGCIYGSIACWIIKTVNKRK